MPDRQRRSRSRSYRRALRRGEMPEGGGGHMQAWSSIDTESLMSNRTCNRPEEKAEEYLSMEIYALSGERVRDVNRERYSVPVGPGLRILASSTIKFIVIARLHAWFPLINRQRLASTDQTPYYPCPSRAGQEFAFKT